jgi:hypothetical protein
MFKVGDKVRIISLDSSEAELGTHCDMKSVGDIIEVEATSFERSIVNNGIYYSKKDLELVEEEVDVNYILLPNSINVAFNGQLHTVKEGDHRYSQILEAVKSGDLEAIPSLIDITESFNAIDGVELVDGRIKLNGKDIPEVVSDRVLKFKEQGLPFEPLVKFAEKLMNNPSFNSRKMLYKFLEHNGHPITKDGNFIAYRKVRTDFTDCHTGKMDNSLGAIVTMDRNEVDDNPDNTCSSGLHVAAYDYASTFSQGHLLEVEIDPEDVVAVPNDYDGEKMRVCKFRVVKICESKLEDVELYEDFDEYGYNEYGYNEDGFDEFGMYDNSRGD